MASQNRALNSTCSPRHACRWSAMLLAVVLLAGCGMDDYKATVRSASTAIPVAVQMEKLFPEIDHFITHYGRAFGEGPKVWNSEAYLGGRYYLTMQVDVDIDYTTRQVTQAGDPKFYLTEYKKVMPLGRGAYESTISRDFRFGPQEWKKLFAARGDFTVIGFTCDDSEVPCFSNEVAAVRRDRVPVSLLSSTPR
jgi:hypothetical protein